MPTVDDIYPSKKGDHLKAADLKGKEIKAEIEGFEVVEFNNDSGKEKKLVLSFTKTDKTLVLNKTNSKAIESGFGGDIEGWIGKSIFIYPTTTDFGGQTVDCIRVRPELPSAEFEDDQTIPF